METKHPLKTGDILVSQWGYSMSLVNFYQVTKLVGKTMVEVVEVAGNETATGFLSGNSEPLMPIKILARQRAQNDEKPVRRRVNENGRISITECESAYPHKDGTSYYFNHCD